MIGASVGSILILLSGNFIKMILISFLLAVPAAWYVMNIWLQDFAFRADITFNIFILSGVFALFITLLTVCIQSFKAANINPVECLRDE